MCHDSERRAIDSRDRVDDAEVVVLRGGRWVGCTADRGQEQWGCECETSDGITGPQTDDREINIQQGSQKKRRRVEDVTEAEAGDGGKNAVV